MEAVIAVVLIVMLVAGMIVMLNSVFGAVMRRRYLHRERMAALDKGVPLPDELLVEPAPDRRRPSNHTTAINGIIWAGLGLGLILSGRTIESSLNLGSDTRQFVAFLGLWAYPALLIGLGLLVYAYLIRDKGPK